MIRKHASIRYATADGSFEVELEDVPAIFEVSHATGRWAYWNRAVEVHNMRSPADWLSGRSRCRAPLSANVRYSELFEAQDVNGLFAVLEGCTFRDSSPRYHIPFEGVR